MTTRTILMAFAILMTTATTAVPQASAGPCELGAVCVNSEDCRLGAVCVNSDDCRLGAVCVGSEDCYAGAVCVNDHDCRLGAVCVGSLKSYTIAAIGSIQGLDFSRGQPRPCSSTAVVALSYQTNAWSYSQHFVTAPTDNAAASCAPGAINLHRSYSSADSALVVTDGDSWTITRHSETQFGGTEITRITFVNGGALFEQSFTAFDGRPLWQASGFLASPQAL